MSDKLEGLLVAADTAGRGRDGGAAGPHRRGPRAGVRGGGGARGRVEEAELSAQQAQDLLSYLEEHGIEVLAAGEAAPELHAQRQRELARARRRPAERPADRALPSVAGRGEAGRRATSATHESARGCEERLEELQPPRRRPDGRAEPRLAAAVPALDRARAAAQRRRGGRAGQAHRARRHRRQAAHGRGQPAARRVDRQGLRRPRADAARPDPGGLARADPGGREVRLSPRLQVLDVRDLVDPPGGHPLARRQGPHDPHPRAHGRAAEQADPRRTAADPAARARAHRRGARQRARVHRCARCAT